MGKQGVVSGLQDSCKTILTVQKGLSQGMPKMRQEQIGLEEWQLQ